MDSGQLRADRSRPSFTLGVILSEVRSLAAESDRTKSKDPYNPHKFAFRSLLAATFGARHGRAGQQQPGPDPSQWVAWDCRQPVA